MKTLYILGVFALLEAVTVRAGEGSSEGSNSEEEPGRCGCERKSCLGVTGTKVIGCPRTNSFRQCNAAVCTVQACPTGQVWDSAKNACSVCDTGKHIAANLQVCVCDKGKTFDSDTRTCVPCPSGSTEEADRCYCPSTLALDEANNACKACPSDSTLRGRECKCNDTSLFFSEATWTCKPCPGTLTPPRRGSGRSSCRCTGPNQIFHEEDVTCYTCPTGTTADDDNEDCDCARKTGLEFNYKTGACECEPGYTLSASGVCIKNTLNP